MSRLPHPGTRLTVWFYAALFALVLGTSHYLGGPDDVQAAQDTEAALQDALRQAQDDAPEGWTPAQIARSQQAARIAANHGNQASTAIQPTYTTAQAQP